MPEINSIPIFLINLDRRTDRLEQMTARLGSLPFTRISAIDGRKLDDSEFRYQIEKYKMGRNEIAVMLSHRKIWQKIINKKNSYACVLEDDAILSSSFPDFIRDVSWLPKSFDMIKLETFLDRVFLSHKKILARDRALRQLGSMHAGAAGYIFSLQGAIKLLDITQQLDSPVDDLMFAVETTTSEFKVMQICPALCVQENVLHPDSSLSSNIDIDRSKRRHSSQRIHGIHKLWREIKRPYFQMFSLIRLVKEKLYIVRYVPFK